MTKQEIRKHIATLKKEYSPEQLIELSGSVLCQVETLPEFRRAKTILLYNSLPDEVYTHRFIEKWCKEKTILLPVVVGNDLELRVYTGKEDLKTGAYGIEEPTGEAYSCYSDIDLAIIPAVAFSSNGNRLGRGKGYYDRLLPHLSCPKIGVCFSFQLVATIPVEEHDVKMNQVLTST